MLEAVSPGTRVCERPTLSALYMEQLVNWNPCAVISVTTWISEAVDS